MTKAHYELKKVMQLRLAEMQAKNPQFSLRAFAKTLDIHAASLSEFFNGKRQFSPKLQEKIINRLQISPEKKDRLLTLIEKDNATPENVDRIQIDTDSYFLTTDPIYYSILCLIETHDFIEDHSWMAGRLRRTAPEIADAILRLERVGYIKRSEEGKMLVCEAHLMTSDDVANTALRLRHSENLDNAKHALHNLAVDERYFRFETLAIDTENMAAFKQAAQEFINKAVFLSQQSSVKNEVYEFCLNFFPRSDVESKRTLKDSTCYKKPGTVSGTDRSIHIDKNDTPGYKHLKKDKKTQLTKDLQ